MKKIFYLVILTLVGLTFFSSCHTAEESMAIDYVKKVCKSPSSFKLVSCESQDYNWQDEDATYDTTFYSKGFVVSEYNLNQQNLLIDSIGLWKKSLKITKATWVDIEFDAQNSFGAVLRDRFVVIIRDGVARNLLEDREYRKTLIYEKKTFEPPIQVNELRGNN